MHTRTHAPHMHTRHMHVCIGTLLKRAEALGPLLAYGGTQNVCARLNKIKRRQLFWPVAPIMLLEEADQWVDSVAKLHSPCMSFAPKLRQGHAVLPDLAHIDGTSKIQTCSQQQQPWLHGMLPVHRPLCSSQHKLQRERPANSELHQTSSRAI